jgi:hypothetical protein
VSVRARAALGSDELDTLVRLDGPSMMEIVAVREDHVRISTMRSALAVLVLAVLFTVGIGPATGPVAPAAVMPPTVPADLDVQPAALTTGQLTSLLDQLRANHVQVVSTGVNWGSVRPAPPPAPYDWAELDSLVHLARERGLQVRLRVVGAPTWLHPGLTEVSPEDATWYPPTGPQELHAWAGFLTDLTARYGSQISAMEIWNEPNEQWFWKPTPDPRAYAALLRTSYLAIKRVAPGLTVTSGGLSHNDLGFLSAYYTAAGHFPDAARNNWFFDQLGLHPYSGDRSPDLVTTRARYRGTFGLVDENFLGMRAMVDLVASREGTSKHVWISEFGYSTETWREFRAIPDERRAYFLARAYALAAVTGFVDGLAWYHSHPTPADPAGFDILTPTRPTETFRQLARTTGASPPTTPLTLPLTGPISGVQRVDGARIGLNALPARMELYVDGQMVASGSRALSWDTRGIPNGSDQAQLVAWSRDGTTYMSPTQTVSVQN